jgi:hypothetical protein
MSLKRKNFALWLFVFLLSFAYQDYSYSQVAQDQENITLRIGAGLMFSRGLTFAYGRNVLHGVSIESTLDWILVMLAHPSTIIVGFE